MTAIIRTTDTDITATITLVITILTMEEDTIREIITILQMVLTIGVMVNTMEEGDVPSSETTHEEATRTATITTKIQEIHKDITTETQLHQEVMKIVPAIMEIVTTITIITIQETIYLHEVTRIETTTTLEEAMITEHPEDTIIQEMVEIQEEEATEVQIVDNIKNDNVFLI